MDIFYANYAKLAKFFVSEGYIGRFGGRFQAGGYIKCRSGDPRYGSVNFEISGIVVGTIRITSPGAHLKFVHASDKLVSVI